MQEQPLLECNVPRNACVQALTIQTGSQLLLEELSYFIGCIVE